MTSSFALRNQVLYTDEDLIYLQRKGVNSYPMNYNYTSLDALYAVVPISKTVRKKHELQNRANDKARFITTHDASPLHRNGPRFDENHNHSSKKTSRTTSTSSKLGSKLEHDTISMSNNESPGTRSGKIQAGLNVHSNKNNTKTEDNRIDPLSQWEDFVEWMGNQHSVDVETGGRGKENTGGVGKGKGLATEPEADIQCSSEYKQNKEKGKALSEYNPDVGMTYAQCPKPSLYSPIPRFVGNDSNNSIIPAQTQTFENVPRVRQYVYNNGSQPYHYYDHSGNEVRWFDGPNTNASYYQTEFVQGSSKGNLYPSFRVQPNYTNEGRMFQVSQMPEDPSLPCINQTLTRPPTIQLPSLPPNLFDYIPPTRSKRPREDEVIEQPSFPPLKRHNGRQSPPHFSSMRRTPSPSLAPMRGVIPSQIHNMQPSPSFSGMNVPFSLPEQRMMTPEDLAQRHKATNQEKGGWESQDVEGDDCEDDEDVEGEDDEDAEGKKCGEDEYEYI